MLDDPPLDRAPTDPTDRPAGAPADDPGALSTARTAPTPSIVSSAPAPTDRTIAEPADRPDAGPAGASADGPAALPRVVITYCTQCRWLLRAAWYSQELLTTFHRELGEVALRPGTGGVFTVTAGGKVVWDRTVDSGFPEITVLKRRVRDVVAPDKPLGHSDGL